MKRTLIIMAGMALLTACQQTTGSNGTSPSPATNNRATDGQDPSLTPDTTCDTSLIDRIGEPASSLNLPSNGNYRVFGPTDAVTTDFVETRTNIDVDSDGNIKAVFCG
ncbi:MAG: I78 family peptidase inhibitor [Pseudomonadota bacterium]